MYKKHASLWISLMLTNMCFTMHKMETVNDLLPFAGQVIQYRAKIYCPQGHLIQCSSDESYPQYATYAYLDPKPWTASSRCVMRILLPLALIQKNPKQGFELTPKMLQNISLHVSHIDSTDKKNILAALKEEKAAFSKGLDKQHTKSSKIVLSLVE